MPLEQRKTTRGHHLTRQGTSAAPGDQTTALNDASRDRCPPGTPRLLSKYRRDDLRDVSIAAPACLTVITGCTLAQVVAQFLEVSFQFSVVSCQLSVVSKKMWRVA